MSDAPRQWQRIIESDDADPLEVLRTVGTYQRYLDALEKAAVRTARGMGRSWDEVAGALGVRRQSAWAKHGRPRTRGAGQVEVQVPTEPGEPVVFRCPSCQAEKRFRALHRRGPGLVVFDPEAQAHFSLPGPVLWTCPGCGAEQSVTAYVKGAPSPVLWERPG